jgi:hypothetical protein
MLVRSAADKPAPEDDFREFRGERFQAYWIGFLYLPGYRGGSDSLAALEKLAGEIGIPGAVSRLKGMFFCMLRDGSTGELHLFVDNCGLRAAYRTAGTVSTSFLELIRSDPAQCGEISRRAVVEFLELGGYYYQRSLMTGVAAIAREEIITFRPDTGGYTVTKKTEVDVESAYRFDRHEYFRTLAHALSGSTVHIDLTGGIVSRYTAVMLQH